MKGTAENALSIHIEDPVQAEPSGPAPYEPPLSVGTRIGEYVVEALLGEGGFGAVYRGVHPVIGKAAAIKVLSRRHSGDPSIVSRFVSEARAANTIRHSGIVDVFAFGQMEDGRPYYVMELLHGQTLHELLRDRGRLPLDEAVGIFGQVATALDAAHAAGIAHRDLKPENIFLVADEGQLRAKLLDFGVAKLLDAEAPRNHRTETGATLGTPSYMAPEQCMGRSVDHRADVYAFGVLVFETLTGVLPFRGGSTFEVMVGHVNLAPPRPEELAPELGPAVGEAVLWMLEKAVDARPQSVGQAMMALSAAASGAGFTRPTPPPAPSLRETLNQRPAPLPPSPSVATRADAKARTWMLAGGGALLAAVALAIVVFSARSGELAEPTTAPSDTAAAPANGVGAAKAEVEVTIDGAPAEATVFDGRGDLLRRGSGAVRVERGAAALVLFVEAPGYERRRFEVVPDRDQRLEATLARRSDPGDPAAKVASPAAGRTTKATAPAGSGEKATGKHKLNELEPWE